MPRPTVVGVALGVGVAGALVDVSTYLDSGDAIDYTWGRQTWFEDIAPGEVSFTLNNYDGRFTPENPASPYATTLVEGASAVWQIGTTTTRLVQGKVQSIAPAFPDDTAAWSVVRITCDDALGVLARRNMKSLVQEFTALNAVGYWPLQEDAGAASGSDVKNVFPDMFIIGDQAGAQFGASDGPAYGFGNSVELNTNTDTDAPRASLAVNAFLPSQVISTTPTYTFWVTPLKATSASPNIIQINRVAAVNGQDSSITLKRGRSTSSIAEQLVIGTETFNLPLTTPMLLNIPYQISITASAGGTAITPAAITFSVSINNAVVLSGTTAGTFVSALVQGITLGSTGFAASFSHLSVHGATTTGIADAYNAGASTPVTATARTTAIANLAGYTTSVTGAAATQSRVGAQDTFGKSALEAFQQACSVDAYAFWATTTGTLTSPTTVITQRFGTAARSATVKYTLHVENDLAGAPDFIRDLTNRVSNVTATSATNEIKSTNAALFAAIGDVSESLDVPAATTIALRSIADDRIRRGAATGMHLQSIIVDLQTTPADRWPDLMGTVPGDRIQITALPTTQLGFSTWDGWFVGADESHTEGEHTITLYLMPCLSRALFDTDRFQDNSELSITTAITNAATSFSVATSTGLTFTTNPAHFPQNIIIDREIMTVTAVTAATPQVFTVTRAQAGTLAAAHTISSLVHTSPASVFDF